MAIFYLETSALVKHYRQEKGSAVIELLFDNKSLADCFVISFLSIIEFTGVITRLQKGKIISEREASGIMSRFNEDCLNIDIVPVNFSVLEIALEISRKFGLRALDSVHLATMVDLKRASAITDIPLVSLSADKDLCESAIEEGIKIINPEDENKAIRMLEQAMKLKSES